MRSPERSSEPERRVLPPWWPDSALVSWARTASWIGPSWREIVFADRGALGDLNAIVHPLVRARSAELAAAAPPGAVVVHDVPLLVENGLADQFDAVVVVEADREIRLARLAARGLSRADAEARMAAQATDEQRRAIADEIVRNDSDRNDLAHQVAALWARLRPPGGGSCSVARLVWWPKYHRIESSAGGQCGSADVART